MRRRMEAMVRATQDTVCGALESLDGTPFREDVWERPEGGGGRTRVLQDGEFFEKAGVNVSVVHGEMPAPIVAAARGRGVAIDGEAPRFFATGVSLVLHPRNPMAPTVHANYRYFEVESDETPATWWFGGGTDLTPCYLFDDDAAHFHETLKAACDRHDPTFYPRFKEECDRYFHIAHRDEARGIGGIFFDNLNDRDADEIFAFSSECAGAIVPGILPIYERRGAMPYTDAQKHWQELRRGRYAEFNLVYDRGTTFGLRTKGRTESILMSLPLIARWEYDHAPAPDSEEARLVEVLRNPRDWVA